MAPSHTVLEVSHYTPSETISFYVIITLFVTEGILQMNHMETIYLDDCAAVLVMRSLYWVS